MSLEHFDQGFIPRTSNFLPGLESLTDGVWVFTIQSAELTKTPRSDDDIVRWTYDVENAHRVEATTFLRTQANANSLGSDLFLLGFATNTWTAANNKLFSHELPKALANVKGIRFRAQKTSKVDGSKTYHNLKILGLAGNSDMPTEGPLPF
jgi:hypothetical protein